MSRRLDLSKFAGSDSEGEEDTPKRQLELNALKSKTFSHGITKKTKKDLEKEAEERKRIEEEKAAALVMAEYERAFKGDDERNSNLGGTRGGFRGRPMGPGGGFVRAGGAPMHLPVQPPRGPAAMGFRSVQGPPPMMRAPSPPPQPTGPKPKGKRAMDSFLEEIKNNKNAREQRFSQIAKQEGSSVTALAAMELDKGRGAMGDSETTNLFISNLPSNISEESLGMFFAKLGPVGAVKIMWPRGDEDTSIGATMTATRRNKPGLSGFVSYMKRDGAERALKQYDGVEWGGSILRVGWSKPVPLPLRAMYDLGNSGSREKRGRSRSRSPRRESKRSSRRASSASHSPPPKRRARSRSDSASSNSSLSSGSRSPPPRRDKNRSAKDEWLSRVTDEQAKFIKTVAGRVKEHGKRFEDVLREKEGDNPKFAFLFNEELPDYHLYRKSVDSRYRVPTPPPEGFEDEGYASLYSSDSAEDSEKEYTAKGKLGRLARKRFEAMLRGMEGKRAEIGRGMEFALRKAEAADEVAEVVCQSLRVDATPVPRKLARLHLISDILHNSASPLPNVWRYRQSFERRLPQVFAHLATVYQSLLAYSGKISADVFKAQVDAVLDIWERWIVFNSDTAELFRALLDGTTTLTSSTNAAALPKEKEREREKKPVPPEPQGDTASKFKATGFKPSFKPIAAAPAPGAVPASSSAPAAEVDLDGEPMEALDGEPLDGEDLDGEPLDGEDLDGEPLDGEDLDGEPLDIDGEPLPPAPAPGDEPSDGKPMEMDDEDDLDGEAMGEEQEGVWKSPASMGSWAEASPAFMARKRGFGLERK